MHRKGVPSMMFKAKPMGSPISVAFPEMMAKNQRITQLVKMAKQSTRLCTLQVRARMTWDDELAAEGSSGSHLGSFDWSWKHSDRLRGYDQFAGRRGGRGASPQNISPRSNTTRELVELSFVLFAGANPSFQAQSTLLLAQPLSASRS